MINPVTAISGILVGNAFPLSLVRRRVVIKPASTGDFLAAKANRPICSYWGHANTLAAASAFLGVDLTPATARPVLACDPDSGLPSLDGEVFAECWVVSPEYAAGFRPAIGAEVPAEKITGWQVLRLKWEEKP